MVARRGRGWVLAPCLVAMIEEADRIAPNRNRKADGSIGDAAHRNRKSDHNPSRGYVTALDLTHNPAGGFDAHARARAVIARRDPRIKYVISDGQIARGYARRNLPAFAWERYRGSNPHRLHAHFSVRNEAPWRDDRSPWWPVAAEPTQEDDEMWLTEVLAAYDEAGHDLSSSLPAAVGWSRQIHAKPEHERLGALNWVRDQLKLPPLTGT